MKACCVLLSLQKPSRSENAVGSRTKTEMGVKTEKTVGVMIGMSAATLLELRLPGRGPAQTAARRWLSGARRM